MSFGLVSIVTFIYFLVTAHQAFLGNYGLAFIFGGYTIANLGLLYGLK